MRPWYRIHLSTLSVLAIVVAWLVFINIPGDRTSVISNRYSHGWPYHYFEREGPDRSFWSFAGTSPRFIVGSLILNALTAFCIAALVALACEIWIRRNGRLFRFGLRAMFSITAGLAVLMGFGIREVHHCQRQNRTLRELAQLGNLTVNRDLRKYDWFRSMFGQNFDGSISRVVVVAERSTDSTLPDLTSLRRVKHLKLENIALTESDVNQLASLPKLQTLSVRLPLIRPQDAAGLRALTALPELWFLSLHGDAFTDETLALFSPDTQFEIISLGSTRLTMKGLVRLSHFTMELRLWLDLAQIRSEDCANLAQIPNLRLSVIDNKLNAQDEGRLRMLFPHADIEVGKTADTGEKYIRIERERPRDTLVDRAPPY